MPSPRFTQDTLAFLRALKRNNDREWFRERKAEYERVVRQPMVEFIERMALDLPHFAPDLVASPKVSLYRVYRDTRFSRDKSPLKTHIAAIFPHRELSKHGGAGLYFHVAPDQVFIGGGSYMPDPRQLYRVRRHMATTCRACWTSWTLPRSARASAPFAASGSSACRPGSPRIIRRRNTSG